MISTVKHWFRHDPTGGILQALLLALVTAVICSAGLASAGLTPSPSGDADGQPVWIMDSCDQLTEPRTAVRGIVVIIADIICEDARVSHDMTLCDSLHFVRYAREPQQCRDTDSYRLTKHTYPFWDAISADTLLAL